jgi:hypothetical protein
MELGTGIFLASLVMGFVFLFHTTKDRWNWKKIMKIIGVLVLLGVCALFLSTPITKWFKTAAFFQPKLTALTELNGLKLGSNVKDAKFLFGNPDKTGTWDGGVKWWRWVSTPRYGKSMLIAFIDEDSISRIRYTTNDPYDCFLTVCRGYDIKRIQDKLGRFDSYTEGADGTMRWYAYKEFNTDFIVERGKVVGFEIGRFTR